MTHYHMFIPHLKWVGHYVCETCGFTIPGRLLGAAIKAGATLKEVTHAGK